MKVRGWNEIWRGYRVLVGKRKGAGENPKWEENFDRFCSVRSPGLAGLAAGIHPDHPGFQQ